MVQRDEGRRSHRRLILKELEKLSDQLSTLQQRKAGRELKKKKKDAHLQTVDPSEMPPSPVIWMLSRLVQQNEELHALLKQHQAQPLQRCEQELKSAPPQTYETSTITKIDDARGTTPTTTENTQQDTVTRESPWHLHENLPEVEWTDEEEALLDKLLDPDSQRTELSVLLPLPGAVAAPEFTEIDVVETNAALEKKRQQKQQESENRGKSAQLFDASSPSRGSGIRRPQWRIEEDIQNGRIQPFDGTSDDCTETPMPLRQVFRSSVIAVMMLNTLQRLLREKKLRAKAMSVQDLDAMLAVYFDATRAWLAKTIKTPLLSIIQDPALDIDVSVKSGLFHAPSGLSKWFSKRFLLHSSSVAPTTSKSSEQSKVVKLKVRVKGVVAAIAKAIETDDVPRGILEFWKRMTDDGVYFPDTYPLFESERQALDLDDYGATREMAAVAQSTGHPRRQVVLVNFILMRVMLPHVLLRPWDIGFGVRVSSNTDANLRAVATLVYHILQRLSPLPPIIIHEAGGGRHNRRRRSVEIAPASNNNQEENGSGEPDTSDATQPRRYLAIDEIHGALVADRSFPTGKLGLGSFIDEQALRLRGALDLLSSKLRPPPTLIDGDGDTSISGLHGSS